MITAPSPFIFAEIETAHEAYVSNRNQLTQYYLLITQETASALLPKTEVRGYRADLA